LPYLKKKMLRLFDYFTVLLMLFLLFIVFFQVLNRFILHIPLSWTEEAARYGFVWLSLFGAVKALQTGSHIKVDIFINNLKPKTVTNEGKTNMSSSLRGSKIFFPTSPSITFQ
jgi:TRAP-type C4-dicarboxylate transport system permease small subunit